MSEPKKYRKKPVTIQAMRMPVEKDQDSVREIAKWMVEQGYVPEHDEGDLECWDEMYVLRYSDGSLAGLPEYGNNFLEIETLEGEMTARPGDYIIKGIEGEFYPCRSDIFHNSYEEVTNG